MQYYQEALAKYAVFTGRATRAEFWWFVVFNAIISTILTVADHILHTDNVLTGLYCLAVLLPMVGVSVRRLHDTGRTGWWLLIDLIPIVGVIVLILFFAQHSEAGTNAYGSISSTHSPMATPAPADTVETPVQNSTPIDPVTSPEA